MSVVTEVGRNADDEREPTWEEAVAALEAASPVEVVRPLREITVIYRYADGIFTATSPEIKGFRTSGPSLHETRGLVRQDLERFLDPAVKVRERFPATTRSRADCAAHRE
jgi:predicted RNase H-like HicB family nuclease